MKTLSFVALEQADLETLLAGHILHLTPPVDGGTVNLCLAPDAVPPTDLAGRRKERPATKPLTQRFPCPEPGCEKAYATQHGVRVHVLRAHSKHAARWRRNVSKAQRARRAR